MRRVFGQTENNTKAPADSGFFRREYFPTILSYDGTIQVGRSVAAGTHAFGEAQHSPLEMARCPLPAFDPMCVCADVCRPTPATATH